jgi:hypothetical protein
MYRELLNQRLSALHQQPGLTIYEEKISPGINDVAVNAITKEIPFKLDPELLGFYQEMNGLMLRWFVERDNDKISGSILISTLSKGLFGYKDRIDRSAYEDALEEELWYEDSYEEESIVELKKHRIFETIEGLPAAVTYKPKVSQTKLYFVNEETIEPILPPFPEYVKILFEYLGASGLREILTSKQWEKEIQGNAGLQTIAQWSE